MQPGRETPLRRPFIQLQQTSEARRERHRRTNRPYQAQTIPAHRCGKFVSNATNFALIFQFLKKLLV